MPEPSQAIAAVENDFKARHEFVLWSYDRAIKYYWRSSARNKRAFKWIRLTTIILGSVVTLLASLSSSDIFTAHSSWRSAFGLGTPLLAGLLTVLSALAQTFQWEASWRESVMTAERLAKDYDRIKVSKPEELDAVKELDRLNDFVLSESEGFFDRVLGRSKPPAEPGK